MTKNQGTVFDEAFREVVLCEGGFVHHPADRGGATNLGITAGTLAAYEGRPVTDSEVRAVTPAKAKDIYRKLFWDFAHLGEIKDPILAKVIFNQYILTGASALTDIQRLIGVKPDGNFGPITIAKINEADTLDLCLDFMLKQEANYVRECIEDHTQLAFLSGWTNRVHHLIRSIFNRARGR